MLPYVKIEPPRKCFTIYFRDRHRKLQHVSSGIPHSPDGANSKEKKERGAANHLIASAIATDLQLIERGNVTAAYIKTLFNAAMQRALAVYAQNGTQGISVRGFLTAWLKLQTHLNEGRKIYQGYIDSFCEYLEERQYGPLFLLDRRNTQEFIDVQLALNLSPTTINNKLGMLESAFDDAVKRNWMICNVVCDDDYLDEERMRRRPLTLEEFDSLYERWTHLAKTDSEKGPIARDWLTASKYGRYAGMRLGDATNQIRANVLFGDEAESTVIDHGFLVWEPEKTAHLGRIIKLPMHSKLYQHLLPWKGSPQDTKLTPLLSVIKRPELCTMFKQELIATDIDPEEIHVYARNFAAVSFHSHKHYYADCLLKALVPEDRRKHLTAHTSNAIKYYEHAWTLKQAEVLRPDVEKVV